MGDTETTTSNYSSKATFGPEGQAILGQLQGLFSNNPQDSNYGQFFLDAMQGKGFGRDKLQGEIDLITQQSDAALPRDLAKARTFTRNRPDTFGGQVASNVVADNMIGRDLSIARLLREQGNIDQTMMGQAASALAGLDANRMSQGTSLLSLLRGESGTQTSKTKSSSPMGALGAVGGLLEGGGGLLTGLAAFCWVAQEVYGYNNPKWKKYRSWMFNYSPRWFFRLYVKHGERFAKWLSNKPLLKRAIRIWMDGRVKTYEEKSNLRTA